MKRLAWFGKQGAVLAAVAMTLALYACGINQVPTQDEQVKAAWSQVQNEYQRRADLVPNLVNTVKGYAQQERTVLREVIEARAKATSTTVNLPPDVTSNPEAFQKFEQSQNQLTQALGRLMVVSERYPDLKSNQNFLALQSQLEGTENRITVARKDYIDAVQTYNTTLRTIPQRWIAGIFYPDAKVKQTFSANEPAQTAPRVSF
ncbi:MAG: LemA family protein [Alphaproteobacteria bacterium]|nr:LemA family protein [Alphaproteobacteria bacterium]